MRFIIQGVMLIALLGIYGLHFFDRDKVAYIDNARLVSQYQGMIDASVVMQAKMAGWQARVDTLKQEWEAARQSYLEDSAVMSKKERALARSLINNKGNQYVKYKRHVEEERCKSRMWR